MTKNRKSWSTLTLLASAVLLGMIFDSSGSILRAARVWITTRRTAPRFEICAADSQPATGVVETTVGNSGQPIYLHAVPIVTQEDIVQARVVPGHGGFGFNIAVWFNDNGSDKMMRATALHLGKPLAIVLDGKVIAAPTLRNVIGRDAVITGNFTLEEAEAIAAVLN